MIPVIAHGMHIPLGLSISRKHPGTAYRYRLQVRFPLLMWHMRGYDIADDTFKTCWWTFHVLLGFERQHSGVGIRLNWGWWHA